MSYNDRKIWALFLLSLFFAASSGAMLFQQFKKQADGCVYYAEVHVSGIIFNSVCVNE